MTTIDIVILGFIYKKNMGAYDIQVEIENRNISKWVKISRPAIYKNLIRLEKKGYIRSDLNDNSKKKIYAITDTGKRKYSKSVEEILNKDINIFLDINSVVTNFDNLNKQQQIDFLEKTYFNIEQHLLLLESNIELKKNISQHGKQLMKQQKMMLSSLLSWTDNYLKLIN